MIILHKLKIFLIGLFSVPYVVVVLTLQALLGLVLREPIKRFSQKTLMLLVRYYYLCLGIKVIIEGKENIPQDKCCVFMSNHQSIMDILLIYGFVNEPMAMIAKKELLFAPVVGPWLLNMGCYLLDRTNPRQALKIFEKASDYVKKGYPALIYPEGTRSRGPKNHDFLSGSMRVAIMSNAPIIPITLNGSWKTMHGKKGYVLPTLVKIVVGKPIDTTTYTKGKQQELAKVVQSAVEAGFTSENEPDATALPLQQR